MYTTYTTSCPWTTITTIGNQVIILVQGLGSNIVQGIFFNFSSECSYVSLPIYDYNCFIRAFLGFFTQGIKR